MGDVCLTWSEAFMKNPASSPALKEIIRRSIYLTDNDEESLSKKNTNRCSLFTDKGYVRMATLANIELKFFNDVTDLGNIDINNDNDDTSSSDDDDEAYLEMTTPVLNKQLSYFQPLRSNSSLSIQYDRSQLSAGLSKRKVTTLDTRGSRKEYSSPKFSHKTLPGSCMKGRRKSRKIKTTLYKRLMREIKEDYSQDILLKMDENALVDELDFNGIESRMTYHSLRGWVPKKGTPLSDWMEKFPEDLSVNELFLFVLRQGNIRLAEYLYNYQVDGFFMSQLLKDDLLLDDKLFDAAFLSENELKSIREQFYPTRNRCFAVNSMDQPKSMQYL